MNYKLCVDQTHAFGYQCARCDRTYCLTCDQPSDVEQVKTIVHYCQDWRCQREKQIEEGQLDVIPKKTLANVEKMRTALQELKTRQPHRSRSSARTRSMASNEHVTDMRKRSATTNENLFYTYPSTLVTRGRHGTLIKRPLEWFLRDLASIAKKTHHDLMLCWIRDAFLAACDATEIQLFTGADDWRGQWTLARGHLIGSHGYRYLTFGFVKEPDPRWIVVGARRIQAWNYNYTKLQDDDSYTRDARTL